MSNDWLNRIQGFLKGGKKAPSASGRPDKRRGGARSTQPVTQPADSDSEDAERTMVIRGSGFSRSKLSGTSILTEMSASEMVDSSAATAVMSELGGSTRTPLPDDVLGRLPLMRGRTEAQQQKILTWCVILGFVGLIGATAWSAYFANKSANQVSAVGQALMQSQRLAKSVSQAVMGEEGAFTELKASSDRLVQVMRELQDGGGELGKAPAAVQGDIATAMPLVEAAQRNAGILLAQKSVLTGLGQAVREINKDSVELLNLAEAVTAGKLRQGAGAAEVASMGQVAMLTQRMAKGANEMMGISGASPEAVGLLGRDLQAFQDTLQGLIDGAQDGGIRSQLQSLQERFKPTLASMQVVLNSIQGLSSARRAQLSVLSDSERLRTDIEAVQTSLSNVSGVNIFGMLTFFASVALLLLGGYGFLRLFIQNQAQRARVAEDQRFEAERQEQEAKRVNDANQAAILRLMNELQTVAEGDLTQHATVTEDITGAIADSVNYTVEELRHLVAQVQGTVGRVMDTTQQVESTSTELLAASTEQLHEIRQTGESVLQMAGRINDVSSQAQETASVARQSLNAAETGFKAVQDTIGGMNTLRDQIQETAKRIKRLGESSQEIGEITELISDITEQTNVLALNAAIQAASAGEAGRGFSVVAEEVQRLAERSADATKQIAALVKAIQTDTQGAVGAMERSTQGVVEGARLSDAAGSALNDIDRVTRQLADLIEQISAQANHEAESANVVAANIQHIFAVTEQTSEGTRSTTQMVHELAMTAQELKDSVSRFKIA